MILLTGATGFIGKHLYELLKVEYGKENILVLTSSPMEGINCVLHNDYEVDSKFFNSDQFKEVDTIVHAGAFIPKKRSDANNIAASNSNINNTAKLLNCNKGRIKKFIFLSTVDVYGDEDLITEESIPNPVSLYGLSKLYCEKMIQRWAEDNDVIVQILRVGHVYGPGEEKYEKLIPVVMKNILEGNTIRQYGEGKDIRSFIYIGDLVAAIAISVKQVSSLGIVNLVSDEQKTIKEILDILIEISETQTEINKISSTSSPRHLIFDNSKLKKHLGIPQVSFVNGIRKEWEYFKSL